MLALLAEVGAPLPDGDRDVDRRVEREQAHRPVAAVDERADVAGAQAVAADELERGLAQLLAVERDRHVVQLGRLEQAVDVVVVAEDRRADLGVVAAHALEDARAVVQAVREYVDLRVLPGDELPVHPDEVRLLHVVLLLVAGARALPRVASAVRRVAAEVAGAQARRRARGPPPILGPRPRLASEAVAQQHRGATGTSPAGWRSPGPRCRAPSRGRARRRPGAPRRPATRSAASRASR